jgi:cellulose synthase/poly-beta-1,6-N-acetylglucosamine synthase-like glycosyltransferase
VTLLFWVSVALVVYTYLGYPLVLWGMTWLRSRPVRKQPIVPAVSIIVAARNEADKIRRKIEHTLALDYPSDHLEIIVASDASDDGTDDIVSEYAGRRVRLVRAAQRKGKEHAQSLALMVATGEIVVFTDAATTLEPLALRRLVENFADSSIGAVSSEDSVVDAAGNPTAEGVYVRYEMWVRRLESRFHSIVGLSGSCFAMRRRLCGSWSATLASDFMAALHAARGGYRAVADASARGRFTTVPSTQAEMTRRVRTFLRGITVLMANLDLLNPLNHGRFAFQLASHKLLRFMAPLLLIVAFLTSMLELRTPFWIQVVFYGLAGAGGAIRPLRRFWPVRVAHYFIVVQWAMLMAWGRYVLGEQQVTWEPSRRDGLSQMSPPSA